MTTRELRFRLLIDNGQFVGGLMAAGNALGGVQRAASSISFGEMARGAVVLTGIATAARAVASAIQAIPTKGISFLADAEVSQLGMAGILQSMTEINGKALTFAEAQAMAAGSVERLQRAAAETSASSSDLIGTFRALVGPALAAGMTLEQVERLSVVGANAVKSMGMTTGQIVQEMRDLVQGGITASGSTLATSLGLKDEDIQKAKRSTEGLYAFLMQRMAGFKSTSDAYAGTLKGGWEALEEQITQASARSMAPAAEAAKGAIREISAALKSDQATDAFDSMGRGAASLITTLTGGIGIAQQYGGAITTIAMAFGALKIGAMASQFMALTSAKSAGAAASRLAAAQTLLSAEANVVETQTSAQKMAALLGEHRVKVQGLAIETALTAARLRSAEASAAQLIGVARMHAIETQVLPLRQQHTQQTAALTQAQHGLATATNSASVASRAMGATMSALGGPVGIFIAALTAVAYAYTSMSDAAKAAEKSALSESRIRAAIAAGKSVDAVDAGRASTDLNAAKERRDELLIKSRTPLDTPATPVSGRIKAAQGPTATAGRAADLAKELAEAEANVARLEILNNKISAAQEQSSGGVVSLRAGVSNKQLEEALGSVKTTANIKRAHEERLQAFETNMVKERELMLKRGASGKEFAELEARATDFRAGAKRDVTNELNGLTKKEAKAAGGGESAESKAEQLEKASADLRLAQLKQASAGRTSVLDAELQGVEALHQRGLTGIEEYEEERLRISSSRLVERLALIDAEIAAENKRTPKTAVEQVHREKRVVELITERNSVTGDIKSGETGAAASTAARGLERQRTEAAETAQVWQQANTQIQQLRAQNSQTAVGMITDPVAKLRAETAAQVAALKSSADELTKGLELKIGVTTDPGQRAMLKTQVEGIAEETARAIELANDSLAERMKPGWRTMLEGWRDTTKLMREASDQAMSRMLGKAEDSFVNFRKTGKLNLDALVGDWVDAQMRMEFRKFMGGETGGKITGALSRLTGGTPTASQGVAGVGNAGAGDYSAAGMKAAFGGPDDLTSKSTAAADSLSRTAQEGVGLSGVLDAVGKTLGGFGGDVMRAGSALLSMIQSAGSGAAGGGGGSIASLLVAGMKAWSGGVGSAGNAGAGDYSAAGMKAAFGYAKDGAFDGDEIKFASGGSFTNQIVSQDTKFRFRAGGEERLGLMGEAGPEAIMPLSGGGAQAISADGRKLGNVPVQRGPSGRLSVVLDGILSAAPQQQRLAPAAAQSGPGRLSAFAVGAVFGGSTSPATSQLATGAAAQLKASATPAGAMKAGDLSIDASTVLNVMDMGKVQAMVSQACMGVERRIYEHLRATGAMR